MKVAHSIVMRIYLAVFFLFWALVLVLVTIDLANAKTFFVIVPTALFLLEISVGFKAIRVCAFYDEAKDRVVVRNYFGNDYLPRRQIRSIELAPESEGGWLIGSPVRAITRDGKAHPVDVFTRPLMTARSRARHDQALAEMRGWVRPAR